MARRHAGRAGCMRSASRAHGRRSDRGFPSRRDARGPHPLALRGAPARRRADGRRALRTWNDGPPPRRSDDAASFVHDVHESSDGGWRVVSYRFALGEAARQLMDAETAIAAGDVFVAPPSTWLLRPEADAPGAFRFHVSTTAPARFLAGTHPSPDGAPDTFQAPAEDLDDATFAAFGPFHAQTVTSGAARIELAIAPAGSRAHGRRRERVGEPGRDRPSRGTCEGRSRFRGRWSS